MDIIKDLKQEHKKILVMFDDIDKTQDLEEKKGQIRDLRAFVAEHLRKEDEYIYPALSESEDEEKIKLGRMFSRAMKEYTIEFLDIVDSILKQEERLSSESVEAYKIIRDKIKDRVTVEETILFPAFLENK